MPAEIDTGGHRVLHCDSRADCPTATPIHASTFAKRDERRIGHPNDGNESTDSKRRILKDRRRRIENCVRITTEPLELWNYRTTGDLFFGLDQIISIDLPARISWIVDEEERISEESDYSARSRKLTQPRRRRVVETLTCLVSRESPRAIENVSKDERLSVTWNSQADASERDKAERAESRLLDETERSRLAIANASGSSSIARRRSLQDRSWTVPGRPLFCGRKDPDTTVLDDHLERTWTVRGGSLLSSHRSHACSKKESREDGSKDISERFFGEKFDGNDKLWTNEKNARSNSSGRRDKSLKEEPKEKLNEEQTKKIGQNSDRKRIRRVCCLRSFLQLAFLFFLVVFGRCGLLGSSSVLKFSARPTASGLSVMGISAIIGAVRAVPIDLIDDGSTRAERSANLSHITGASRKILMYVKNRHLQILPDGTVNGSNDDTSDYTIFRRISVSRGQLRIQSLATCLYLCMDFCGLLYGSSEFTEECVFNETLEPHNYNTYSSVRWSTKNKTLYLGLNRYGQPRKIQVKGRTLGKLSGYARVLTRVASTERVEALQKRMMSAHHNVRHRHNGHGRHRHRGGSGDLAQLYCPTLPPQEKDGRDRFRCRKRKKRKKRKRRCRPGERPGPQCQVVDESTAGATSDVTDVDASSQITVFGGTTPESKRSCEGAASEEACRRQALSVPAKKRKSRIDGGGGNLTLNGKNKAPTSNAKKPNVSVADSQSKKPDLTDGKKRKKKGPPQASRGTSTMMAPPSRKRLGPGTTSSPRASSSQTAHVSEVQQTSTATSSSSPSPPGASTDPSSVRRPGSPAHGRRKPSLSSKSPVTKPLGSRRVGKSFPGNVGSPGRSRSTPATSETPRSEIAHPPPSTTKVPETTCASDTFPHPRSSPVVPSSSLSRQNELSTKNSSGLISNSSLVDEESSSTVENEFATEITESGASTTSGEIIAEVTTVRSDEEDGEDGGSGMSATIPRITTRFPLERLAM